MDGDAVERSTRYGSRSGDWGQLSDQRPGGPAPVS